MVAMLVTLVAAGLLALGCSSGTGPATSSHATNLPTTSTTSTTSTSPSAVAPTTTTPPSTPPAASAYQLPAAVGNVTPYWLLETFSVSALLQAGLSPVLLQDFFDNARTFVIVKAAHPAKNPSLPNANYVMSFANYNQLASAINSGSIPPYIKLVLYDNEMWPATPAAHQQQPFAYEAEADALAHQHGLGLIFTPAANLSMVLSPSYTNATKYDGYTGLGIASQAAPHADVLEIQAQQDEAIAGFTSFVSSAVSQAQAANAQALIMVGLTTTAPHQVVTPQVLRDDYDATRPLVSGYWLNIPGGRGTGPRNPQVAVAFLQGLAPQLGY
jgi:hypothetical protein